MALLRDPGPHHRRAGKIGRRHHGAADSCATCSSDERSSATGRLCCERRGFAAWRACLSSVRSRLSATRSEPKSTRPPRQAPRWSPATELVTDIPARTSETTGPPSSLTCYASYAPGAHLQLTVSTPACQWQMPLAMNAATSSTRMLRRSRPGAPAQTGRDSADTRNGRCNCRLEARETTVGHRIKAALRCRRRHRRARPDSSASAPRRARPPCTSRARRRPRGSRGCGDAAAGAGDD